MERTEEEIILTLRIPKDVKKEDVKVEYREGKLRIRYPRKKGLEDWWERISIE